VIIAVGIAVVSLWEYPDVPKAVALNDKLVHGLMYALLAFALMRAWISVASVRVRQYVLAFMAVTAYGALIEILQRFCTLSRSGEMADLYADALGALVALILLALWQIIPRNR
jgi:VanZ family protein